MLILRIVADGMFVVAAVCGVVFIDQQVPGWIALAVSSAAGGALFLAFDKIIRLLTDIRLAVADPEAVESEDERPVEEIEADLQRIRSGLQPLG